MRHRVAISRLHRRRSTCMIFRHLERRAVTTRRRLLLLPIIGIALLVQVMAPIGAFRVAAQSVSDPTASICSGMTAPDSGPAAPNGHGGCCVSCATSLASPPVPAPVLLAFVTLQRHYQRIAWREATNSPTPNRVGSNAQARAPPLPI